MKRMANRCACLLFLLACLCVAASQLRPWHARSSAAPLVTADNTTRTQVNDPALVYLARTLPGQSIAVDAQGNAYLLAPTRRNNNWDLVVMKLNPTGTQLIYELVIGGSEDDFPQAIAVDAAGNAYLTGHTFSADLPGAATIGANIFFRSADGGVSWERGGLGLRTSNRAFGTLLVDPNNPSVIYAGAAGGDNDTIFKSVDSGRTWSSLTRNLGAVSFPRLLAVQGGAATTIYVGTREGLRKSTDGGATWSEVGLQLERVLEFMVIDPTNPARLYVASGNRLYSSVDGAATWQEASNGLPGLGNITHLTIDRKTPTTLYAIVSPIVGRYLIYRTTDGARSWSQLPSEFTDAPLRTLTVDAFDSATLYLGTARGLFKSADGGQSWQAAGLADLQIGPILSDPNRQGTLYAAAPERASAALPTSVESGVYKSTDGGRTWRQFDHRLRRLPVTGLAFDPQNTATLYAVTGAYSESFAIKLNASGAQVDYAKYFGPGAGTAVAVDARGNAYLAGALRPGLLNAQMGSGPAWSFVAPFNAPGENAAYNFTWAGQVNDLAFDQAGKLYVVGTVSRESGVPIKNGWRTELTGETAGFLVKLDPEKLGAANADGLLYGTYLGLTAQAVAVDAQGRATVLGTGGNGLLAPFTNKLFDGAGGGLFLAQLDTTKSGATSLAWSAPLAAGTALGVDAGGNIYVTGAASAGYPTTPGALQTTFAGGACGLGFPNCTCPLVNGSCPLACQMHTQTSCSDAFVTKISADGTALIYSTYLGTATASFYEAAKDIAVDAAGNVYLTGVANLPPTAGALQSSESGFVAKLTLAARSTAVAIVSAASFAGPQLAPESLAVGFLDAFGAGANNLRVQVRDSTGREANAPMFYSGPGQVNFQLHAGLALGPATVRVLSGSGVIANGAVEIVTVAPGVFAANANGRGVAAAAAQRVTPDNTQSYEPVARYDPAQSRFVAVPIDLDSETDQIFLVLFGTGWRYRSAESAVKVTVGGVEVPVTYAGLQPTLAGVDQINARLPRSLRGRGEVDVVVTVDGRTANTVRINIK